MGIDYALACNKCNAKADAEMSHGINPSDYKAVADFLMHHKHCNEFSFGNAQYYDGLDGQQYAIGKPPKTSKKYVYFVSYIGSTGNTIPAPGNTDITTEFKVSDISHIRVFESEIKKLLPEILWLSVNNFILLREESE